MLCIIVRLDVKLVGIFFNDPSMILVYIIQLMGTWRVSILHQIRNFDIHFLKYTHGESCWFFLCNIESHSLVEWRHLVKDQDVEPVLHWGNSALYWVVILLNGYIWSQTTMWNQSCIGGTHPCGEYPFFWMGHLVKDQDVEPIQHW